MGLRKCDKCENLFHSRAGRCPNCGTPVPKKVPFIVWAAIVSLAFGISVAVFFHRAQRMEIQLHEIPKTPGETEPVDVTETKYQRLVSYFHERKFEEAFEVLLELKKMGVTDYKEVSEIARGIHIHQLTEKARGIPSFRVSDNLRVYRELLSLDPENEVYRKKAALYQSRLKRTKKQEKKETREKRDGGGGDQEILIDAPF